MYVISLDTICQFEAPTQLGNIPAQQPKSLPYIEQPVDLRDNRGSVRLADIRAGDAGDD